MIPVFPDFVYLQPWHASEIADLTKALPEYSDYSPASLIAWDINQDTQISNLRGNLVVIFSDYIDGSKFISIHGTNHVEESLRLVDSYARNHSLTTSLKLIPEETALAVKESKDFVVSEDRDNYDYIVNLQDISMLTGKRFRRVRQQVNIFETNNSANIPTERLDLQNRIHIEEMRRLFHKREDEKPDNDDASEMEAMERLFKYSDLFDLEARGISVNGKLEAFIIIEKGPQQLTGHFAKANVSNKGIYSYLLKSCCKEFSKRGYESINLEQDLGIEGLRTAKEQLRPNYLKKYSVRQLVSAQTESTRVPLQLSLSLHF